MTLSCMIESGIRFGLGRTMATGGKVALSDITVENGRIKGLDMPLDKLFNDPGQNQT